MIDIVKGFISLALLSLITTTKTTPVPHAKQEDLYKYLEYYSGSNKVYANGTGTWVEEISNLLIHPDDFEKMVTEKKDLASVKAARIYVNLMFAYSLTSEAYNANYTSSVITKAFDLLNKLDAKEFENDSNMKPLLAFAKLREPEEFKDAINNLKKLDSKLTKERVLELACIDGTLRFAKEFSSTTNDTKNLDYILETIKGTEKEDSLKNLIRRHLCPIFTEKVFSSSTDELTSKITKDTNNCLQLIKKVTPEPGNDFPVEYLLGIAYLEAKKSKTDPLVLLSYAISKLTSSKLNHISESLVNYYKSKLESNQDVSTICASDIESNGIKITAKECTEAMESAKKVVANHDERRKMLYFEQNAKKTLEGMKVDKDYIKKIAQEAKKVNSSTKDNHTRYSKLEVNNYYRCVDEEPNTDCWIYLCTASLYQSDLHEITKFMCHENIKKHDKKVFYKIPKDYGGHLRPFESINIASEKQTQEMEYAQKMTKEIK